MMIAIAISLNPILLIADEPTTALDQDNQELIVRLLDQIRTEYRPAMLLVSHDLKVMARLTDRLIVMRDGKVREQGPTKELLREPADSYTRELLAAARILEGVKC